VSSLPLTWLSGVPPVIDTVALPPPAQGRVDATSGFVSTPIAVTRSSLDETPTPAAISACAPSTALSATSIVSLPICVAFAA